MSWLDLIKPGTRRLQCHDYSHVHQVVSPRVARFRTGHADHNLAVLRQIALNLLRQQQTTKVGVKTQRLKAGWSNEYLLRVLGIQK